MVTTARERKERKELKVEVCLLPRGEALAMIPAPSRWCWCCCPWSRIFSLESERPLDPALEHLAPDRAAVVDALPPPSSSERPLLALRSPSEGKECRTSLVSPTQSPQATTTFSVSSQSCRKLSSHYLDPHKCQDFLQYRQ